MARKSSVLNKGKLKYEDGDKSTKRGVDKSTACNAENSLGNEKMKTFWGKGYRPPVYPLPFAGRSLSQSRRNVRKVVHRCFYCDWIDEVDELMRNTGFSQYNFHDNARAMQFIQQFVGAMRAKKEEMDLDMKKKAKILKMNDVINDGCKAIVSRSEGNNPDRTALIASAISLAEETSRVRKLLDYVKEIDRKQEAFDVKIDRNQEELDAQRQKTVDARRVELELLMTQAEMLKQMLIDEDPISTAKEEEELRTAKEVLKQRKEEEAYYKNEVEKLKQELKVAEEKRAKKEAKRAKYRLLGHGAEDVKWEISDFDDEGIDEEYEMLKQQMEEHDKEYKELVRRCKKVTGKEYEKEDHDQYLDVDDEEVVARKRLKVDEDVMEMTDEMRTSQFMMGPSEEELERQMKDDEEFKELVRQYELLMGKRKDEDGKEKEEKEGKKDRKEEKKAELVKITDEMREYELFKKKWEAEEKKEKKDKEGKKDEKKVEDESLQPTEPLTPAERLKNYPIDLSSEHVSVQEVHAYLTKTLVDCEKCKHPVYALPIPSCTRVNDVEGMLEDGVPPEMTVFLYCETCNSISEYGMCVPLRELSDHSLNTITALVSLAVDPKKMK